MFLVVFHSNVWLRYLATLWVIHSVACHDIHHHYLLEDNTWCSLTNYTFPFRTNGGAQVKDVKMMKKVLAVYEKGLERQSQRIWELEVSNYCFTLLVYLTQWDGKPKWNPYTDWTLWYWSIVVAHHCNLSLPKWIILSFNTT